MTYNKLITGFSDFKNNYYEKEKGDHYKKLVVEGQNPETLVIACSDSRIDPAILTQSDPGEFFAVRNVAALVPPYNNGGLLRGTSSAIEYAVRFLNVGHIVVLGHAGCGGINALATGNFQIEEYRDFEFLDHWLNIGEEARAAVFSIMEGVGISDKIRALEQASIIVSISNLLTFPWIRNRYEQGHIHIHGWYFDMNKGELLEYQNDDYSFQDISNSGKKEKSYNHPNIDSFLNGYTCVCSEILDVDQG